MKMYLKIFLGEWKNASRDKRELSVAEEMGYQTLVISGTKESKSVVSDVVDGFNVIKVPTRRFGEGRVRKYLGYLWGFMMYIREAKKIDATIISGHNYGALLVGFLSICGKKCDTKLIYDSHEFELYQKDRSWLAFHGVKLIERFLVKRTDINMMVTETIAEKVQQIYMLKKTPLVIRNIPNKSILHEDVVRENRKEFLEHLHMGDNTFIVMHHGGIVQGRGVEEIIRAVSCLDGVGLVIMGYAIDAKYREYIIQLIRDKRIENRVYLKDAVPFQQLYDYVAAADVGVALTQNTCINFYYSLPNKLFENIQAKTPVIGSDLPEISKIINQYQVGLVVQPDNIDEIVAAISKMKDNVHLYQQFKENENRAREELCWEVEKIKLKEAIEKI